jgi:hypothetical protein
MKAFACRILVSLCLLGCGSGPALSTDVSALEATASLPVASTATDVPVIGTATDDSYSVSFAGDDAGLSFSQDTSSSGAFMTGGGWIVGQSGGKATFGFVVGNRRDGTPFGHFVYIDHGTGYFFRSTSITLFEGADCYGRVEGQGESSSGPTGFRATMGDSGDPGTPGTSDVLLFVTEIYSIGAVQGGQIEAHRMNCPF